MNLHLWVRLIDPRRIPFFSVLPYGCQWKECTITVLAWEFIGEMPADADLPPPEDNGNRCGPYARDNEYYVRQTLLQFHDCLTAANQPPPSPPEPSSDSTQTDSNEPSVHNSIHQEYSANTGQNAVHRVQVQPPKTNEKMEKGLNTKKGYWNPLTSYKQKAAVKIGKFTIMVKDNGKLVPAKQQEEKESQKTYMVNFNIVVGQVLVLKLSQTFKAFQTIDAQEKGGGTGYYKSKGDAQSCAATEACKYDKEKRKVSAVPKQAPDQNSTVKDTKESFNKPKTEFLSPKILAPIKKLFSTTKKKPTHTTITYPAKVFSTQTALSPTKLLHTNTSTNPQLTMELTDEQFVEQFAALSSGGESSQPIRLPQVGLANRQWNLCALLRVATDKSVIDHHFASTMMKAWGVDPATDISILARNMFLAQFTNREDLEKVMQRGIWTYRTDAVFPKRVRGSSDLEQPAVEVAEVWTQWHRVPPAAISKEGIHILARELGTPISEPVELFVGGHKIYKVKMLIKIDGKLKDRVDADHPELGTIPIYITYEKLPRICLFCSKIGHESLDCAEKLRLERLRVDPRFRDLPQMQQPIKLKVGAWINNSAKVPLTGTGSTIPNGPDYSGPSNVTNPKYGPAFFSGSWGRDAPQGDNNTLGLNLDRTANMEGFPNDPAAESPLSRARPFRARKIGEEKNDSHKRASPMDEREKGQMTEVLHLARANREDDFDAQTSGVAFEGNAHKKRTLEESSARPPQYQ